MPDTQQQVQLAFGGAANPTAATQLLGQDEVATATNIDFSYERGAASVRRGTYKKWTVSQGNKINAFYRRYVNNLNQSPIYALAGTTVYRGSGGSFSSILSGITGTHMSVCNYHNYAFIVPELGTQAIKDDGTAVTDWIKQNPATAPAITITTIGTSAVSTFTVAEGTATTVVGLGSSAIADATSFRVEFDATPLSTNLSTASGGATIGDDGQDTIVLFFSDPSAVKRVSLDYSIGDTTFKNCWHAELNPNDTSTNTVDPSTLIESQDSSSYISKAAMYAEAQRKRSQSSPISYAANSYTTWKIRRPEFTLIGASGSSWSNIQKTRIIVEGVKTFRSSINSWQTAGGASAPLFDSDLGYVWFETWATADSDGNILGESCPSPSSGRFMVEGGWAKVVSTASPTGNHGITHRIFYRQGGFLQDAYAVTTVALATTTATDTLSDIKALTANNIMQTRDILPHTWFPNNVVCISEPFYERIFVGHQNHLNWSLPGVPDAFPTASVADVSDSGDEIKGLVVWPPGLVIINRDSVYEMHGNVFEGSSQDWILQRTGSRHGNNAGRAIIKTPYGIPLLDSDGIYMYVPGQGVDIPLDWVMDKIGDAFRGAGDYDPVSIKGDRVPAINRGYVDQSCAAYHDGKLYLGIATDANTVPSTLFVLDFSNKQVWWYTYPWNFTTLWWDQVDSCLYAGTTDGNIMWLDYGNSVDQTTSGSQTPITWKIRTRSWTAPSDSVLENVAVEYAGGNIYAYGIYDGTGTNLLGTLTNSGRDWSIPKLGGTVCNNACFEFRGTQATGTQNTLYGMRFDAMVEPPRVSYYKTPYDLSNTDGEKLWDVHYADLEVFGTSGYVYGTMFVDNVAVGTMTATAPSNGRKIYTKSFPSETYGCQAYTLYNCNTGVTFKHWDTRREARNEPPRVNTWRTDIKSLEENICDGVDFDLNPNGTVTSTVFLDNVALSTFTTVGTNRQSYTNALPVNSYGRTIYTIHNGVAFKHYQTWYHMRPEPDRWTSFTSERQSDNEQRYKTFEAELDCYNSTVYGVAFVDGLAVSTQTFYGMSLGRHSYVQAMPPDTYGRSSYALYYTNGGQLFKHYRTWFEGDPEPDRLSVSQWGPNTYPSDQTLKTWVAELNPIGTCTGVLYANGTAISTATFIAPRRTTFNVGLDLSALGAPQTAIDLKAVYTSVFPSNVHKHYNTNIETESRPFGKTSWLIRYNKLGGASAMDMARQFDLDIEPVGTATVTSYWDVDDVTVSTATLVYAGREWKNAIPFPPGARGYNFQQRVVSAQPFRVWKSSLDTMRFGLKGLSRISIPGTPVQ